MCRLSSVKTTIRSADGRPEGVSLFLFGSVLNGSLNSDIDLLCVYDEKKLTSKEVYGALVPFFRGLEHHFGSRIHPVILTEREELQVQFIETEGCVFVV